MGAHLAKNAKPGGDHEGNLDPKREVRIEFTGMNDERFKMQIQQNSDGWAKKRAITKLSDFLWRHGIKKNEQDIQIIDVTATDQHNYWLLKTIDTYRDVFYKLPNDRMSNVLFNIHIPKMPEEQEIENLRGFLTTGLRNITQNFQLRTMFGFITTPVAEHDDDYIMDGHRDDIGY
jgi:hypothetical protein